MKDKINKIEVNKPKNLDLEALAKIDNWKEIPGISADKVVWLCHAIQNGLNPINVDTFHYSRDKGPYYISIHSEILKGHLGGGYKRIMKFLIDDAKLIESDESYLVGEYAIGYKLTDRYLYDEWVKYEIKQLVLYKRIKKELESPRRQKCPIIKGMASWFSKLTIDSEAAYKIVEKLYEEDIYNATQPNDLRRAKFRNSHYKALIAEYSSPTRQPFRDYRSTYRVYSLITSTPRSLRHLVKYDGQSLVQVDLSASQLYFSTFFLNPKRWSTKTVENRPFQKVWQGLDFQKVDAGELTKMKRYIRTYSKEPKLEQGVQSYIWCIENDIYTRLACHFAKITTKYEKLSIKDKRTIAKKCVLMSLFDNTNKPMHCKNPKSEWNMFCDAFPVVGHVFKFIKRKNYKDLAWLLQRIESTIMVDFVVKRLQTDHPHIPIFLLHDCIVTTKGNEQLVNKVMIDEITSIMKYAPKTDITLWNKSKTKIGVELASSSRLIRTNQK